MAATSGPLSWTSTSTQSTASFSSGTPGPTSQSSGTLVVPSFISTYSSFGGSSIVSTLPATSSTNLPVVVGGSCGGATGSESSTFPNLNKALVVGPGYAPVPYKLVSKITAGLFVDLADLLPDNIRAQEIEPQAFLEGKLVVSGSKKRVIEIADIVTWIEAFTIFSMILCHTFPSRWKDLNQYKLLIIQTARGFFDNRGSTTTSPSEKKPQPQVQPTGLSCTQTSTIFSLDFRLPLQLLQASQLPLPCH